MNIVDKNGVWFQSSAAFPLNDPESKTTFWPGEPVKATETEWVKGQPAIARIDSPLGEDTVDAASEAAAKAATAAKKATK